MRILNFKAENIKRLVAVEITPEENVVKITGKNKQGKTSVLDAIFWALGGTRNIQEKPIRKGQKSGNIVLDLGEYTVTRSFTEKGSYLQVENKDGFQPKSPQALLDKLVGDLSFNPLAFAKADDKTQIDTLLKVINLELDKDEVKKIAGLVVMDETPIKTLQSTYKAVFDERTAVNRDLERVKKVLATLPEVEEIQAVSLSDLLTQKAEMEKANNDRRTAESKLQWERQRIIDHEKDLENVNAEIKRLQERVVAIENTISSVRNNVSQAEADIKKMPSHDLTEITEQINNAESINKQAQAFENRKKVADELQGYVDTSEVLTARLEAIRAYKQNMVAKANMPVPGLDFVQDKVYYNEVPFEQASSAQKLQVSLAIAMALNPKLRVMRIDDGSLLDSEHMAIIEKMAEENDYQVWVEVVDESGKVGIYIEDGMVVTKE